MFRLAKLRFPGIAKDLRHLAPLPPFNPLVEVLKRPAQLFAQSPAYTALTRAHESDQDYSPCSGLPACRLSLAAKHTKPRRSLRALSRPFPPIRFSLRFLYCFSERFLR